MSYITRKGQVPTLNRRFRSMNLASACGVFVALAVLATFAISTGAGAALPGRNGPLAAFTERESREGTYG
ncbi:MAG: hypothetical protein M3468_11850, partial [Acidobacteriota bacterium]|nr:hypothetical protein [Acidobacteriota bacterium]